MEQKMPVKWGKKVGKVDLLKRDLPRTHLDDVAS